MTGAYFDTLTSEGKIPAETFDPVRALKHLRQQVGLRLSAGGDTPSVEPPRMAEIRRLLFSLRLSYGKCSRRYRGHTHRRSAFRKDRHTESENIIHEAKGETALLKAINGISFVSLGVALLFFAGGFLLHDGSGICMVGVLAGLLVSAVGFGGRFLAENGA